MKIHSTMRSRSTGFSLIEIAVVLVIVSVLLAVVAIPLSAQVEARRTEETRRQLDVINEALVGFAMANGRLPCAARIVDNGIESLVDPANPTVGACYAYSGLLPAVTLGLSALDQNGFAVDAWGIAQNRIRYAVIDVLTSTSASNCPSTAVAHVFTARDGMKTAGMNCLANYNLDTAASAKTLITVCSKSPAASQPFCAASKLTITAPFVVISLGKNAVTGGLASTDEGYNAGTRGDGRVFVSRIPSSADAAGGEFDDIVTWTSLNTLFARMVQAGKLP